MMLESEVLKKYEGLCRKIAGSFDGGKGIHYDDLVAEGRVAVLHAWRAYGGVPGFTSIAGQSIENRLKNYFRILEHNGKAPTPVWIDGRMDFIDGSTETE